MKITTEITGTSQASRFSDSVQDVGRVAGREILDCVWTAPREATYDPKL